MRVNISFRGNHAISEVVGGLLLVVIAVITFSAIYLYAFPSGPDYEESVRIDGSVTTDGNVVLEHVGGNTLENYKIIVHYGNGTLLGSKIENNWNFGECRYPLEGLTDIRLLNDTVHLGITVCSTNKEGDEQQVFTWDACGQTEELRTDCPILISSLKTNTVDEDLICYSYPVIPGINATTYIYNWKLNGVSLTDLNMPFNTEDNNSCTDYSGDANHGTLNGANWTPDGKIGGCYYLDGSSEYITMDLPNVFYDIPNNDFTVSIWVKSDDITADNAVVLMASADNNNFFKIFIQGSEIHVGLCVNGIKDAVRTENLTSNEWYHIVAVWDASENLILVYWNGEGGVDRILPGYRNFAMGSGVDLLEIGHGTASSKFWDGFLDELIVYNKALSPEQIYQIYYTTKDGDWSRRVLVSEETSVGDYWQCVVTPNDGVQDDPSVGSNTLQIVNYGGGD